MDIRFWKLHLPIFTMEAFRWMSSSTRSIALPGYTPHRYLSNNGTYARDPQQALVIAKDRDLEAEARALHGLGKTYGKVLKADAKAHDYFSRVLEIAESLKPKDCSQKKWYVEAKDYMDADATVGPNGGGEEEQIRASAKFMGWMKAIRERTDAVAMVTHLYLTHPPKNESKLTMAIVRKMILQVCA